MPQFKKLVPNAKLPERKSEFAAAYDLYFAGNFSITLHPEKREMFGLGFACAFPPGHVGVMKERSGLASRGIHLLGGVIDPDYRGEWKVILYNSSDISIIFNPGDRIAQVLFVPVVTEWNIVWVDSLDETIRGEGGIGSTGV